MFGRLTPEEQAKRAEVRAMLDRLSPREPLGRLYGNLVRDSFGALVHLPRTILTHPKQSAKFLRAALAVLIFWAVVAAISALAFHFESPTEQRHQIECPVDQYGDRDC